MAGRPKKDRVIRVCASCGISFPVKESQIRAGRGTTCSKRCAAKWAALEKHRQLSQNGSCNPNYRHGAYVNK